MTECNKMKHDTRQAIRTEAFIHIKREINPKGGLPR